MKAENKHVEYIEEVFEKLKQYDLKLSLDECEFLFITYLRQIIDAKGKKSDQSGSSAIKNMPAPINVSNSTSIHGTSKLLRYFYHKYTRPRKLFKKRFEIELQYRITESF